MRVVVVVLQDRAAFAEVCLRGRANDVAFEVARRRGSKVNQLTFTLGGKDMTRQASRHGGWQPKA